MRRWVLVWLVILTIVGSGTGKELSPTPPAQPVEGPGGSKAAHASVTRNRYGSGNDEYWLYEPAEPTPRVAPVIVFFHGWGGMNPANYGAWIDHLVRRGNIVIYPRYQADLRTAFKDFTTNAIGAIKNALRRLQTDSGHVRPELNRFAVVGHSVGGILTANVAALASESGLPKVRAMMSVEPAPTSNPFARFNVPLADLSKIPSDTLVLAVAGDNDTLAKDHDAKRVFAESTKVAAANKNYITLVSDDHAQPGLNASHFAPAAPDQGYSSGEESQRQGALRDRLIEHRRNRQPGNGASTAATDTSRGVDALDYYGLWKLFDGLCDAAFYQRNREYALGNTAQQRFMGMWSDGTSVKELRVTTRP